MSRYNYDYRTVTNEERYGNVTVRNVFWEKWDRLREDFIQGISYEVLYGDECIAELDPDGVTWAKGESFERLIWNMAVELAYDMACKEEFQEWNPTQDYDDIPDRSHEEVILVKNGGDLEIRWETFDTSWSVPDEDLRYDSLVAVFHVCGDETTRRKVIAAAYHLRFIMNDHIYDAWEYYGLCDESEWQARYIIGESTEQVEHILNPRMTIVEYLDEEHVARGYALFVDGRFQVIAEQPEDAITLWRFKSGEVPLYE